MVEFRLPRPRRRQVARLKLLTLPFTMLPIPTIRRYDPVFTWLDLGELVRENNAT